MTISVHKNRTDELMYKETNVDSEDILKREIEDFMARKFNKISRK